MRPLLAALLLCVQLVSPAGADTAYPPSIDLHKALLKAAAERTARAPFYGEKPKVTGLTVADLVTPQPGKTLQETLEANRLRVVSSRPSNPLAALVLANASKWATIPTAPDMSVDLDNLPDVRFVTAVGALSVDPGNLPSRRVVWSAAALDLDLGNMPVQRAFWAVDFLAVDPSSLPPRRSMVDAFLLAVDPSSLPPGRSLTDAFLLAVDPSALPARRSMTDAMLLAVDAADLPPGRSMADAMFLDFLSDSEIPPPRPIGAVGNLHFPDPANMPALPTLAARSQFDPALIHTTPRRTLSTPSAIYVPDRFSVGLAFEWEPPHGQFMHQLLQDAKAALAAGDVETYKKIAAQYTVWAEKYLRTDSPPQLEWGGDR